MVRPMMEFCCGCSLVSGVKLILFAHLALNTIYCLFAFARIVLQVENLQNSGAGYASMTCVTAFCLAGIPIIFIGLLGVYKRIEPNLRFYFYYLTLSILLDLMFLIYSMVIMDPCTSITDYLQPAMRAAACGASRIFSYINVLMICVLQCYLLYAVWSMCEDLREACGVAMLDDLLRDKAGAARRQAKAEHHLWGVLNAAQQTQDPYPTSVEYDSISTVGFGGGENFFGGNFHDTTYPPAHH